IHLLKGALREAAQAAMEISHSRAKENFSDGGEYGVPDVTVLPRHRPRPNAALKAVSHHHVIPRTQLLNKGIETLEVIAVICVAHDAVATVRRGDRPIQRRPVAANRNMNPARAQLGRNLLRSVGRAVIADNDFAADFRPEKITLRLPDAVCQSLRLVQAGHYDAEFYSH